MSMPPFRRRFEARAVDSHRRVWGVFEIATGTLVTRCRGRQNAVASALGFNVDPPSPEAVARMARRAALPATEAP